MSLQELKEKVDAALAGGIHPLTPVVTPDWCSTHNIGIDCAQLDYHGGTSFVVGFRGEADSETEEDDSEE